MIPVADASVFEELIPNSRKVIFEDTGHMAMLERPASFNELLRNSSPSRTRVRFGDGESRSAEATQPPRGLPASARDGALGGRADELRVLADRHVDMLIGTWRLFVG